MKRSKNIIVIGGIIIFIIVMIFIFILINNKSIDIKESKIKVSLVNNSIDAYTGSFCYNNGCIDKISPLEVYYKEKLVVVPDEVVYLNDLDNNIRKIEFNDFETKEEIEVNTIIEDKSFIVPNLEGTYIVTIISTLNGKDISYSFKLKINKVNEEYLEMVNSLEKDLYSNGYINDNVSEFRIVSIHEYGYYPQEESTRYVQANLYITCKDNTVCTNDLSYYDWSLEENDYAKKDKYNYVASHIIYENNKFKEIKKMGFTPSVIQTGTEIFSVIK